MALTSPSPQPVPPPVGVTRPAPAKRPGPVGEPSSSSIREPEPTPKSAPIHDAETPQVEDARANGPLRVALDLRETAMPASCYLDGLLHGFEAIDAPIQFTLIGPEREVPGGLQVERWIDAPKDGRALRRTNRRPKRGPLDPGDVDLVHSLGAAVPPIHAPRYLLTLHDLPESAVSGFGARWLRRWKLGRSLRRNVRLVTTSGQPRDVLETLLPRHGEAIWMIHSGPGDVRACLRRPGRNGRGRETETSADVRTKRWFLTTSGAGKSANMEFLISAMALWYRKRIEAPRLIWAGGEGEEIDVRWSRIPARARHHIRVMPVASDEARDQLFDEAIAFIIPDLEPKHAYDALEAMNRGVPVLCARRRPFTDLLGQAPLWFDPRDSSTLWRALDGLLDDRTLRPDVVARGLREAARYDWCETAEMTLGAYRQLMRTFPGAAGK